MLLEHLDLDFLCGSKLHVAGSAAVQEEPRVKVDLLLGNITACPAVPHKVVFKLKNIPWYKVC